MEAILGPILLIVILIAVSVAISRWIFRINEIVLLLKNILRALEVGLNLEEEKKPGQKHWPDK